MTFHLFTYLLQVLAKHAMDASMFIFTNNFHQDSNIFNRHSSVSHWYVLLLLKNFRVITNTESDVNIEPIRKIFETVEHCHGNHQTIPVLEHCQRFLLIRYNRTQKYQENKSLIISKSCITIIIILPEVIPFSLPAPRLAYGMSQPTTLHLLLPHSPKQETTFPRSFELFFACILYKQCTIFILISEIHIRSMAVSVKQCLVMFKVKQDESSSESPSTTRILWLMMPAFSMILLGMKYVTDSWHGMISMGMLRWSNLKCVMRPETGRDESYDEIRELIVFENVYQIQNFAVDFCLCILLEQAIAVLL